eukprot:scaffold8602_cov196-Amphora_coffeaeformis.AAC.4
MGNDDSGNVPNIHYQISACFSGHVQVNTHVHMVSIPHEPINMQNHESEFHDDFKDMIYPPVQSVLKSLPGWDYNNSSRAISELIDQLYEKDNQNPQQICFCLGNGKSNE